MENVPLTALGRLWWRTGSGGWPTANGFVWWGSGCECGLACWASLRLIRYITIVKTQALALLLRLKWIARVTIVIGPWAIAVFCVASRDRNVLVWFIVLLYLCIYMSVIFQLFCNWQFSWLWVRKIALAYINSRGIRRSNTWMRIYNRQKKSRSWQIKTIFVQSVAAILIFFASGGATLLHLPQSFGRSSILRCRNL